MDFVSMRLAFAIVSFFRWGGLQRDCLRLARAAADAGHEVTIFTARTRGELLSKVTRRPSFILADATGGVGQCFFLSREKWFKAAFVDRFHECFMRGHNAFFQQRPNGVIHKLHSVCFAGNNYILQLVRRAFADDRGDRWVRDQNFVYGNAPGTVCSFQKQLRYYPAE